MLRICLTTVLEIRLVDTDIHALYVICVRVTWIDSVRVFTCCIQEHL